MKKLNYFLSRMVAMLCVALFSVGQVQADELTVYDGTDTNGYMPVYNDYGDAPQKHEFIIPASELTAMKDGTISKMTFHSPKKSQTMNYTARVFLKEVEQTTFTAFIGEENSTKVYEGSLATADYKMEISFTTNYEYKGGNLLVGIYIEEPGTLYLSQYFYGVNQEEQTSIMGVAFGNNTFDNIAPSNTNYTKFLPKTTFTYEAASAPAGTEVANIAALKAFEFTEPGATSEDVVLTLTDAIVTYVNTEADFVVIEDASAGMAFETMGLSNYLATGNKLNGTLKLNVADAFFAKMYSLNDGINGVTITEGEATPLEVTADNIGDYVNDFDWRYAKIADITIHVEEGNVYATTPLIDGMQIPFNDRFNVLGTEIADGTAGTITGFLFDFFGSGTFFTPTAFEENVVVEPTEVANIAALKAFEFTDPAATSEDVVLTLTDAIVTYVNTEADFVVIEDASAGMAFETMGLSNYLATGNKLNGTLKLNVADAFFAKMYSLNDGINGVTITEGEATPLEVTADNIGDYVNDFDWRYAKIADITIHVEEGNVYATTPLIDGMQIPFNDRFNVLGTEIADGTAGTITGFLFDFFGSGTFFTPTAFEENVVVEPTQIANIEELKNFELSDPTAESEDVVLTLTDAKVTYVNTTEDYVIMEDASAGYMISAAGLSEYVAAGNILNGSLAMTATDIYMGVMFSLTDGINGVTITEGDVTPLEVTADNVDTYVNDFDWRLAKIADVKISITAGTYGDEISLTSELLGEDPIGVYDRFGISLDNFTDGAVGTITGYLVNTYGLTLFLPLEFTADEVSIKDGVTVGNEKMEIYNVNGQRLNAPTRGLNIINGKKIMVK